MKKYILGAIALFLMTTLAVLAYNQFTMTDAEHDLWQMKNYQESADGIHANIDWYELRFAKTMKKRRYQLAFRWDAFLLGGDESGKVLDAFIERKRRVWEIELETKHDWHRVYIFRPLRTGHPNVAAIRGARSPNGNSLAVDPTAILGTSGTESSVTITANQS
jgi:hypothetical protein